MDGGLKLLAILFIITAISCKGQISKENVTRVLAGLASDEMKGRETFSPGIDRAAELIISEFESVGLDFFEGLDSYKQSFSMVEYSLQSSFVKINGKQLDKESYFIVAGSEEFNWENNVLVETISKNENFQARFAELHGKGNDLVVLVDMAHEPLFKEFKASFDLAKRAIKMPEAHSLVVILGSEVIPSAVSIRTKLEVHERVLANIVGMIPGKKRDEIVIFSAHYDHIGVIAPVEGDSIANGANDNASGVAAVIELASYFKAMGTPERTLLFVAFTAEEMGGYGSRYFSRKINPGEVVAMFNIEMIGKPAVEGPNTAWVTGFDKSSFGAMLQKSTKNSVYKFYPDPYPSQNLFYRSDNATLARLGVPAHTISTTPIDVDKDYHQVSDEIETLNMEHVTNTIKAIAKGAEGIVSGRLTPTRVDKASLD